MSNVDYSQVIENSFELDFYKSVHEKILIFLAHNGPSTFWQLVKSCQGSDRRVLRLLNQMVINQELLFDGNKFKCIEGAEIKTINSNNAKCDKCYGKIVKLDGDFLKISDKMNQIYTKKPAPTFLFDQRPVTAETTTRRVAYLAYRGDLINKRIAVIGDDDLTSIAIGLTGQASEVAVFDIDKRLINFINKIALEENINVKAFECDLTKEIPKEFLENFDVFLTDPTPNPDAFLLFISVGLALLKKGKGFAGYVSFFPSHQDISVDFQRILTERNVIITDMIPKFTEYDFIKETYKPADLELLRKYSIEEPKLSFHENLTRFETSEHTIKDKSKVDKKKLIGKATKRILGNLDKDPAFISGDKKFVEDIANSIKEGLENE